jgi:hypothetical protein
MSKKLSVTPTLFNPKISSNADAKKASTLLLGLTYSFAQSKKTVILNLCSFPYIWRAYNQQGLPEQAG